MDCSIYRYILRHSLRGQILVVLLTLASLPLTYYALDVPKQIINKGIEGEGTPETVFGYAVTQIEYLLLLCFLFLGLVVLNGGFKFVINVYKGVLGERLLRRLRYELYNRVLRFPLPRFKWMSQGEIIAMTTAETEPLAAFIGDAIAEPALQGGVLLTYLFFIFNQDPFLGAAAVALYPIQIVVVPRLQRRVNALSRDRVRAVRGLADRVGEGVSGISEIRAHGTARYELADVASRLGRIFDIRFEIYKRKYFIKFLNSFLASVTPFFFYSAGGYFVIVGELSIGALVAVLAAYKDLNPPWKELLKYYQVKEDMQVKYGQIVEQFSLPDLHDAALLEAEPAKDARLDGPIALNRVTLSEDGVIKTVDGVTVTLAANENVAILGPGGSGKNDLGELLARLVLPTGGHIRIGELDLAAIPAATLGRHMGYVGQGAYLFAATVFDNLAYSLKQRPVAASGPDSGDAARAAAHRRRTAAEAGNITDDIGDRWVDYELAGVQDVQGLRERMLAVLHAVGLAGDVYQMGLRTRVDPAEQPDLADRLVEARLKLRARLEEQGVTDLVEPFDEARFNGNASVAENLLFGTPLDDSVAVANLAANADVVRILKAAHVYDELVEIGRKLAMTMVELFAGLPPEHEFFEQFSFIGADDLPDYRALLARVGDHPVHNINASDQRRLLSLAFKLVPARHRLGLIDDEMQQLILDARHRIARELPESCRKSIAFFDSRRYNPAATLEDNIMFGKVVHGAAQARERVGHLIDEVLDELDLRQQVVQAGLDYEVGIAGGRLSPTQRQKIAIARALLKRPDILILNEATSGMDPADDRRLREAVLDWMDGKRVIWILGREEAAESFERVLVMDGGRIVEDRPGSAAAAATPAGMAAAQGRGGE